jgi:hypothetical protein
MVEGIQAAGGTLAQLTIYEDLGHSIWYTVFKEPGLYDWMLSQSREAAPPLSWAGFDRTPEGWVDTGPIIGWLNVAYAPWVWSPALERWLVVPESAAGPGGIWAYITR